MKVASSHVTYCLNVHPGESVGDVLQALRGPVLGVKELICPDAPFGVGLRLSDAASRELESGANWKPLKELLEELGMYAFTVNAFPYGAFHGRAVKAAVYEPDWSRPERRDYTLRVARALARLLPEGVDGSISSVPLGYAGRGRRHHEALPSMVSHVLEVVAGLWRIEQEQGRRIVLALEPEPDCLLQTTEDVVEVFTSHFFSQEGLMRLTRAGISERLAEEVCRRHLTICLDACHAAVQFESPTALLAQLRQHGITVGKLQVSSGLCVPDCRETQRAELRRFDEPVYLHQTVVRRPDGALARYADLGTAMSDEPDVAGEWRIHFHVPIHREGFGLLRSTRPFLEELLRAHRVSPISEHLEVETYTWDVLPDKQTTLERSVAAELAWCLEQCGGAP